MEFGKGLVGVDQEVAVITQAGEHVDHLEQRRILHDQAVRLQDRLPQPDFLVGDAAEGDHGSAHALGPETRERLGVPPFEKGCNRKHLGPGDHPLPTAAVNSHLKHRQFPRRPLLPAMAQDSRWRGGHLALDQIGPANRGSSSPGADSRITGRAGSARLSVAAIESRTGKVMCFTRLATADIVSW